MSGYFAAEASDWPEVVEALQAVGKPWSEGCIRTDLRWLDDQVRRKRLRRMPNSKALGERYNRTEYFVRQLLRGDGGRTDTTTATTLARALAAHPRWRWRGGMQMIDGTTGEVMSFGSGSRIWSDSQAGTTWPPSRAVPDLDDPATCGCLLAILVDADPASGWGVACGPDVGWRATSCTDDIGGASMGEVLAKALLACWGPA